MPYALIINNISRTPSRIYLNFSVAIFNQFERKKILNLKCFVFRNCLSTPSPKAAIKQLPTFYRLETVRISCDITLFYNIYLNYNNLHFMRAIWSLLAWSYARIVFTFDDITNIVWVTWHKRRNQSSLYMIRNILAKFYVNWVIISTDTGVRHCFPLQ